MSKTKLMLSFFYFFFLPFIGGALFAYAPTWVGVAFLFPATPIWLGSIIVIGNPDKSNQK